ncbi:MAG: helix-turn-helix domain-containing protein [Archangium sp.]
MPKGREVAIILDVGTPDGRGNSDGLRMLGRRLTARLAEAGLDAKTLATRAAVEAHRIERFERGEGGLSVGALTRIASVLGIPVAGLISTSEPEVPAPMEPSVLMRKRGTGSLSSSDLDFLNEAIRHARSFKQVGCLLEAPDLNERFVASPAPIHEAHKDGQTCARQVRSLLPPEYRGQPLRNLASLIEDRFNILVLRRPFESTSVQGVACHSGDARVILINAAMKHEAEVRFTLAHELCHHLTDLGEDGVRVDERQAEDTGFSLETPPEEKRANAFAAMLLAPEEALWPLLGPPRSIGHELSQARQLVLQARRTLGLGFEAMAWHLLNMGYLREKDTVLALLRTPDRKELRGFEETAANGLERRAREALERDLISEARYRELLELPFTADCP